MSLAERIWFSIYLTLGPVAWAGAAYLIYVGRCRVNKLRHSRAELPADPPLVSILIPAKDEGPRIAACMQRVLEQDYPSIEVIAVNDRSTDDTGAVLDRFSGSAARAVHVTHVTDLPLGWLGKCHALDVGAKHATGEWFFLSTQTSCSNPMRSQKSPHSQSSASTTRSVF